MSALARLGGIIAVGALVVGCSVLPDRADPSDPSDPTSSAEEDLGTLTGPGRPLDDGQLRRALPSPTDVGDGWAEDAQQTVGELATTQVTPSSCAPLITKGADWDAVRSSQRARVQSNYRHGESAFGQGTFMAVWLYSMSDPPPAELFDDAGALIADCASMDVTQADTGNTSKYATTQLPFPNLGDRTLALRLEIAQSRQSLTMDFVVVKIGHNTVSVANSSSSGDPDADATERAVRSTLKSLEETS